MNYRQIFTDLKAKETPYIQTYEFVRITVYSAEDLYIPHLIKLEHGIRGAEEFDTTWQLLNYLSDSQAIRKAISIIDNYQFDKPIEKA